MKILVRWKFHEGKLHNTLAAFSQMSPDEDQALMGGMTMIGRWHDLVGGAGIAIFEADSAEAVSAYAMNWSQHMDLDVAIVVDDAEARAMGQKLPQVS